jgi:hypothetical protein
MVGRSPAGRIIYTQIANLWSHPSRFGAPGHSTAPTLRLLRPIQVIRACGLSAADLCAVHASAGDAEGGGAVVANQPAREAAQDRRQGGEPWA